VGSIAYMFLVCITNYAFIVRMQETLAFGNATYKVVINKVWLSYLLQLIKHLSFACGVKNIVRLCYNLAVLKLICLSTETFNDCTLTVTINKTQLFNCFLMQQLKLLLGCFQRRPGYCEMWYSLGSRPASTKWPNSMNHPWLQLEPLYS